MTKQGPDYSSERRQRTKVKKGRDQVYFAIREPDLQGRLRIDPVQV